MFVKLYSRITESSLMEQSVEVRYTFLMLLAIADPTGRVVGTDIAIARRLNVPVDDFVKSVKTLGEPDADSNSKEEEGRRVMPSDGERGYQLVNFLKYRNLKDEDEKREYMREYMRKRRAAKPDVKDCKTELNVLAKVTQAEATAEATEDKEEEPAAPVASKKAEIPIPALLDTPEFRTVWADWEQHRREKKQTITPTTRNRQLKNMAEIGVVRAIAAIEESISQGWQGIYEPKGGVAAGGIPIWKRMKDLEEEEKLLAGRLHQFFDREADPAGVARLTAVRLELSKLKT